MGNICSRSKNEPEPFSRPGRVLGSNPPPQSGSAGTATQGKKPAGPRAPLPANSKSHFGSPGRTLGEGEGEGGGQNSDPRANAALAAQVSLSFSPALSLRSSLLFSFLSFSIGFGWIGGWELIRVETRRVLDYSRKRKTRVEIGGAEGANAIADLERG